MKKMKYLIILLLIFVCPSAFSVVNAGFHHYSVIYDDQNNLVVDGIIYNVGNETISKLNNFEIEVHDKNENFIARTIFDGDNLYNLVLKPGETVNWKFTIYKPTPNGDLSRTKVYSGFKHTNWQSHNFESGIKIFVNNQKLNLDIKPIIKSGRTLVPLRSVFEALGAEVFYDAGKITATKGNKKVELLINNNNGNVNGSMVTLDVPPQIMNQRTMVPLRFVTEAFGGFVFWGEQDQIISILG